MVQLYTSWPDARRPKPPADSRPNLRLDIQYPNMITSDATEYLEREKAVMSKLSSEEKMVCRKSCHRLSMSDTDSVLGDATAWACCPAVVPLLSPTVPPPGLSGPRRCHRPSISSSLSISQDFFRRASDELPANFRQSFDEPSETILRNPGKLLDFTMILASSNKLLWQASIFLGKLCELPMNLPTPTPTPTHTHTPRRRRASAMSFCVFSTTPHQVTSTAAASSFSRPLHCQTYPSFHHRVFGHHFRYHGPPIKFLSTPWMSRARLIGVLKESSEVETDDPQRAAASDQEEREEAADGDVANGVVAETSKEGSDLVRKVPVRNKRKTDEEEDGYERYTLRNGREESDNHKIVFLKALGAKKCQGPKTLETLGAFPTKESPMMEHGEEVTNSGTWGQERVTMMEEPSDGDSGDK
ncbi:gtp-binding protein [Musa troglodytarum]|uniref:Gtp-binding protein n=1 Tax=Musa troglodytarum TaxID=320322 RepID=A0A9E7KIE0_9LILI|nr:gtp-binding protein [Musa troglodytarum]